MVTRKQTSLIMHVLEFLSDKPLSASFVRAPASMCEAMLMPKERMIELSEQQIARMVTVSQAVAADVLTDGEHHFMLLGAFACRLPAKH